MQKKIYLFIVMMALLLAGCKKQTETVDFIPTPTPAEEESDEVEAEAGQQEAGPQEAQGENSADVSPTSIPIPTGETTTMYVKLDEYGAFLNVRATPSRDGDIVGSLVHTEKVEVYEIKDGWASFLLDNTVRYVNADFLVKERPEYLTPPSPTPVPEEKPSEKNTPTPTPKPEADVENTEEAPPEI